VDVWSGNDLWTSVASVLRGYRQARFGRILTEDTVRFATARAAADAGVDPASMRVELPHPAIAGARIDLAIGEPPAVLVEFKYPREPAEKNAAWTMTLGEVLKDFYRLAAYPGEVSRMFVFAESRRLRRYMLGAAERYGIDIDRPAVLLRADAVAALPTTARDIIASLSVGPVAAERVALTEVDEDLRLSIYRVAGTAYANVPTHTSSTPPPDGSPPNPASGRLGARDEILDAIDALLVRSGANSVTVEAVLFELRRRGTTYAESTIRTMMTSHMCANAPDHAAKTFKDLERVGRGSYRRL
jgi:hypothetical protein